MSSTYLQGREVVFSEEYYWDIDPCALLKSILIAERYSSIVSKMEFCQNSQYGMMCEPLTGSRGVELLKLFPVGFHAKTLVLPEKAMGLMVKEADCGKKCLEWFAKLDLNSSVWKIRQCSLFEDLEQSLETWPRWGMMLNGECFHVEKLVEYICENASLYSVPTPTKSESKGTSKKRFIGSVDFRGQKTSEALRTCITDPCYLNPLFAEALMGWPIGWTDLKPLAMDKFREWLQRHGIFNL